MSHTDKEKQTRRTRFTLLGVLLFIAAVIIVAVMNRASGTFEKVDEGLERNAWPVSLETVTPRTFTERITASAILQPLESADLTAEVPARVRQIKADLGDRVKKGAVLVRLDGSAYYLNFQAAQALVEQAKAQADLAEDQHQRMKKLFAAGHISQVELDSAESSAKTTKAAENSAKAQLDIANRNMGETAIRAPFDGRISGRTLSPGNLVSPGVPIVSIVQDERMKVELALTETEIHRVRVGMSAGITVPAIPGQAFAGQVTRVGVAAERSTGAFPVRVEIENSEFRLLGGMRCSVNILLEEIPDSIVVARDHVVELNNQKAVFIAEKSDDGYTARFSPVEIDGADGRNLRLLSGLSAGQMLVVVGQQSLKDGSILKPVEIDKAPVPGPEGQEGRTEAPGQGQ